MIRTCRYLASSSWRSVRVSLSATRCESQQRRSLSSVSQRKSAAHGGVYDKIAFIGTGKMAQALMTPLIRSSIQPAGAVSIYDVSTEVMKDLCGKFEGVCSSESIPDVITDADLIVLAVKPQNLESVYSEIRRARTLAGVRLHPEATVLTVIAGKPIDSYVEGTGITKVARSMPNTPAQIGRGITVWTCTPNVAAWEREKIKTILCSFGKTIFVDDESYIDMSTSISGSGPAYIFLLMESLIDAGVHLGFSPETATTLVHHTLLGSTLYAMETGEHPAILRNQVTSPAGTTASAIYELESGKFRTVIKDAVWACYRRSLEMGGSDSNVGPGRMAWPNAAQHSLTHPKKILDYKSPHNNLPSDDVDDSETFK